MPSLSDYTACPDCDLFLHEAKAPEGYKTICPRCRRTISRSSTASISKVLALSIAGLCLYLPAILLPLMTFKAYGFSGSANILQSILNFYRNDYYFVSVMVLLSAVVFPFILLTTICIISWQLQRRRYPSYLTGLFRIHLHLEEWAMVEVYLLGILVTIIKMSHTSEIDYHSGILCFSWLVLITLGISTVIDRDLFWHRIETKGRENGINQEEAAESDGAGLTAAERGLILCHTCHKLSPAALAGERCPRCRTILHMRKPQSTGRTWALVVTSAIFLAPANLLPIMEVDFLGIPDRSTIIDGIIYFFQDGSYLIGLIIFAASVLVPVFKIAGLIILLRATRPGSNTRLLVHKAQLYRFIAFIGRWSMLDIFVIALLSVLVDFGFFTSIHTAPAATYFSFVVAATMFAATAFDPRIIWDNCSSGEKTEFQGRLAKPYWKHS
ncbi:MAG: PqiA/YebS family transporter subunit [Desulforhopalus sp.]|nr:PqiA/YebS family transporter subunit [Desulforhopalus sp.]